MSVHVIKAIANWADFQFMASFAAGREDVAPEGAHWGDEGAERFFVARYKDIKPVVVAFDVHDVVQDHRFAVDMRGAFRRPVDYRRRCAQRVNEGVGIDIAREQVHTDHGRINRRALMYYYNVEEAVGD